MNRFGDAALELGRERRHVGGHARRRHHDLDGADRAGIGAEAMADALVAVDQGRLAADDREHIPFRAGVDAGAAADAPGDVDVRMLGPGPVGSEAGSFGRIRAARSFCSVRRRCEAIASEQDQAEAEVDQVVH